MAAVIERVDSLEQTVQEFVRSVGAEFRKLYASQRQTEAELRLFKDEMRVFKDEMTDFKDEMSDFKDEMRDFKDESRRQLREMNKKWGELSNKLGTLVEDLVAPSLPRIVEERLGEHTYDLFMERPRRRSPDGRRMKEFDAVLVTSGCVYLNSTKATLRITDVDSFVADIAEFRTFFPEYKALPLVGVLASLAVDESLLTYAERQGFLVLAVGDELMEVKNRPGFEPKRW